MSSARKGRKPLKARRLVIKVGSSLVTNHGQGLDRQAIAAWARQIAALRKLGHQVIVVSSGAIAEGMQRLNWKRRPSAIHELQAAAAVGQMGLIEVYESCFREFGLRTAQILLTHADLADRERYLNARSTLLTLLDLGIVPVINENDTVVTDEIKFGDNDTLGALVANLAEADWLVILTDIPGLYEEDPRKNPQAKLVQNALASDSKLREMAGGSGSAIGKGGMITKVQAAIRAARSGTDTIIASGQSEDVLIRLVEGASIGTHLRADTSPLAARKQWLANHVQIAGQVHVDAGAAKAITVEGRSLLPVGVTSVQGNFQRGAMVSCFAPDGTEIARGLVNYNALEIQRIAGKSSAELEAVLGYLDQSELIHRDNLVLL
jgi:glutamate 5-kinase